MTQTDQTDRTLGNSGLGRVIGRIVAVQYGGEKMEESFDRKMQNLVPLHWSARPVAVNVPGREQQTWNVRFTTPIVTTFDSDQMANRLTEAGREATLKAATEAGIANPETHLPSVRLVILDQHHALVIVEGPARDRDVLHVGLIGPFLALRTLHEAQELDDIQGVPIRYWPVLLGMPGIRQTSSEIDQG